MKYKIQENSLRQQVHRFLHSHPHAENSLLYQVFLADSINKKSRLRAYKQEWLKSNKEHLPPKHLTIHTTKQYNKQNLERLDVLISLFRNVK